MLESRSNAPGARRQDAVVCDIEMKKTAAIAAVARDTGVTLSMDWVVFDYCFVIYNLAFHIPRFGLVPARLSTLTRVR